MEAKYKAPHGVTRVSVEQQEFSVDETGHVVVPQHFGARLEAIGFRRVGHENTPQLQPVEEQTLPALYGSSVLPAEVEVGGPNPVQLGLIVASAHERSGFTVEDWNALTDEEREALLNAEVERLKSNNAVLNDLAEKAPKDVRAWLVEQGVNVNGVKNADLLPTAAAYLHEKR